VVQLDTPQVIQDSDRSCGDFITTQIPPGE